MLYELYCNLNKNFPSESQYLYGKSISKFTKDLWFAVDKKANPFLLFKVTQSDSRNDIELKAISIKFSRECNIIDDKKDLTSDIYTVLNLKEFDSDSIRVFLKLIEEIFCKTDRNFSNREIATEILKLSELFKKIENHYGDIVGLWGELYIISVSASFKNAVKCWCSCKNSKFDFLAGSFALEIKTTKSSKRKHRFSIEQLQSRNNFNIYIASIKITEVNSGLSTWEFIDKLSNKIDDNELRSRFINLCLVKAGKDVYYHNVKYNTFPQNSSLKIYDSVDIPIPSVKNPSPIENVRFDVDLSQIEVLDDDTINSILKFDIIDERQS